MNHYVLIANDQKDVRWQYADFFENESFSAGMLTFSRIRVGLLRLIDGVRLRDTWLVRKLFFDTIFQREIVSKIKKNDNTNYTFIVVGRAYEKYGGYMNAYLKKRFPNASFVLYVVDLVENMRFNLEDAKKDFDLVCCFDKRDAEKNALAFVLEPFSTIKLRNLNKNVEPMYDVTFVGGARNRYKTIIQVYEKLKSFGLKLNFHITEVEGTEQKYPDEIDYGWVDFEELIDDVLNSKCVLEIMQEGAYSGTTRYAEAMLLGRNLLTNSPALREPENEDSNIININSIADFEKVTEEIVIHHTIDFPKYENVFSVKRFVETIDSYLEGNKQEDENDKCVSA